MPENTFNMPQANSTAIPTNYWQPYIAGGASVSWLVLGPPNAYRTLFYQEPWQCLMVQSSLNLSIVCLSFPWLHFCVWLVPSGNLVKNALGYGFEVALISWLECAILKRKDTSFHLHLWSLALSTLGGGDAAPEQILPCPSTACDRPSKLRKIWPYLRHCIRYFSGLQVFLRPIWLCPHSCWSLSSRFG